MVRPKDMISISNMPQIRSENRTDNMVADYYEKTVIMPTYLLAFIVCDFGYLQDHAGKKNASVGIVWASPIWQRDRKVDPNIEVELNVFQKWWGWWFYNQHFKKRTSVKISKLVNRMCSHCLFPVVDKFGTSCYHLVTRLPTDSQQVVPTSLIPSACNKLLINILMTTSLQQLFYQQFVLVLLEQLIASLLPSSTL